MVLTPFIVTFDIIWGWLLTIWDIQVTQQLFNWQYTFSEKSLWLLEDSSALKTMGGSLSYDEEAIALCS